MEKREMICINCPLGCMLFVEQNEAGEVRVSGNTCPRGAEYGRTEATAPKRVLTSTVRIRGEKGRVVPVKTAVPIPKEKIGACMEALKEVEVELPVQIGEVVAEDVAGTGVCVVVTKSMKGQALRASVRTEPVSGG